MDDSAYIWVRAVQFHGALHVHHDSKNELIPFHLDGTLYKDKPIITALFSYAEVMEAFALLHKIQLRIKMNVEKTF